MVRKKNSKPQKRSNSKKLKKRIKSKKKICFSNIIKQIRRHVQSQKPDTMKDAIHVALRAAHKIKGKVKSHHGSRVISVPKTGGILPLIPIFAGLSALGALSGGAAGIAKAVNDARSANQKLEESKRHNKTMEAIAMGKGMYLKPYKRGMGLYLKPYH